MICISSLNKSSSKRTERISPLSSLPPLSFFSCYLFAIISVNRALSCLELKALFLSFCERWSLTDSGKKMTWGEVFLTENLSKFYLRANAILTVFSTPLSMYLKVLSEKSSPKMVTMILLTSNEDMAWGILISFPFSVKLSLQLINVLLVGSTIFWTILISLSL